METSKNIGVVGLWHLGCVVAASWSKLGKKVRAVDFNSSLIEELTQGRPPLYEPELQELIQANLKNKTLSFSDQPAVLSDCPYVFLAYDTPVRDDDTSDLAILEEAIEKIAPCLPEGSVVIVSSQLPAGTAQKFRSQLKSFNQTLELVYSPENLQLGRAIECYLKPGHIVVGSDSPEAGRRMVELFSPMSAECLLMSLTSAEMTKHGINSFLATSITFANQLADLCSEIGANFYDVASAMKHDPRIGNKAYLSAGIGFSGGTLGRDLKILDDINLKTGDSSPLFGDIWDYNKLRVKLIVRRMKDILGDLPGKTITLLGMTYKAGTSTLRRSLPLEIANDLVHQEVRVQVYDPKADWKEIPILETINICTSIPEACQNADLLVLLTEWPEFKILDYKTILKKMRGAIIFDPKNILEEQLPTLELLGYRIVTGGRPEPLNLKETAQ